MSAVALEVNDAGLLLLREGERPGPESPGLALFGGDGVLVGKAAASRARLLPRGIHDRYWDRPGHEPLGPSFPDGLRCGDLAFAHLRSLRDELPGAPVEAFLAVPGSIGQPALGLLLTLARRAGFPVVGIVDAAVAAAAYFARGDELLHLDLTRHRVVVTALKAGSEVRRVHTVSSEGPGQATFERAVVEAIARKFVEETRFDPLHSGATEQWLHDSLPAWLLELRHAGTCAIRATAGRREHALELSRTDLALGLEPLGRAVVKALAAERKQAASVVLVSSRVGRWPGLVDRLLEQDGLEVIELPPDAAVSTTLRLRDRVRHPGEALPLVTALPIPGRVPQERAGRKPTHLMHGGVAHVIGEGLTVGTAPPSGRRGLGLRQSGVAAHHCSVVVDEKGEVRLELRSGSLTLLNGAPAPDQAALRAGDRIGLGEPPVELLLVAVEDQP